MECPLVFVEWEDSLQPISNWMFLSDFTDKDAIKCVTVGWLINDGKDTKSIAQNFGMLNEDDDAQVSGVIRIPTRSITKITKLEEPTLTSFSSSDP